MLWSTAAQQFQQSRSTVAAEAGSNVLCKHKLIFALGAAGLKSPTPARCQCDITSAVVMVTHFLLSSVSAVCPGLQKRQKKT